VVEHQGISYPSNEHYYVAMKVNDEQLINGMYYTPGDFREMLATIENPAIVKKLGQKIKIRKDWDSKKLEVMNWGVREKFNNNSTLRELLLSTGDEELIEGNHWKDTFWGVCDGKGKNHLGKILMEVRRELRGEKRVGLEQILNNKNK
jgi:ribA/ribD-fused uncharacterized protein